MKTYLLYIVLIFTASIITIETHGADTDSLKAQLHKYEGHILHGSEAKEFLYQFIGVYHSHDTKPNKPVYFYNHSTEHLMVKFKNGVQSVEIIDTKTTSHLYNVYFIINDDYMFIAAFYNDTDILVDYHIFGHKFDY